MSADVPRGACLYNAFVEYADHYSEIRGPAENRARSAALGSDFKVKARKLMIAEL